MVEAQLGSLGQDREIARLIYENQLRGYGLDRSTIRQQADVQSRQWSDDAAARGAYSAPGTGRGFGDIQTEMGQKLGQVDVSQEDTRLRYEKGLHEMDLRAKELGTTRERLGLDLERGLANLNLDRVIDAQKLIMDLASLDSNKRALAKQIFDQALQMAQSMPPGTLPGVYDPTRGPGDVFYEPGKPRGGI
jgi:hypothetical protein